MLCACGADEEAADVAALLALASAAGFGIADILGAVAARRTSALWVTLGLQVTGIPLLVVAFLAVDGVASWRAVGLGAGAGAVGILGLSLYLRSLAVGPVGVISPVAALVGTAVPVGWGVAISGDDLGVVEVIAVLLGLVAVVLVAWSPDASTRAYGRRGPAYAALAGVSFGMFFVVLDATPADSGLWPLVGSRVSGIAVMVVVLSVLSRPRPDRAAWNPIIAAGFADTSAALLFLFATRQGLLSIVSLLASLSPVVALVLARFVLHERLTGWQATGVALALVAIALLVV